MSSQIYQKKKNKLLPEFAGQKLVAAGLVGQFSLVAMVLAIELVVLTHLHLAVVAEQFVELDSIHRTKENNKITRLFFGFHVERKQLLPFLIQILYKN